MSRALEIAIDALSDPKVGLPASLRRLMVVSHRIEATELTAWLRRELDGFDESAAVPAYRSAEHLPIRLHFDGPQGSYDRRTVSVDSLHNDLAEGLRKVDLRQPVAELEALATGDTEPTISLPGHWVNRCRELATEGRAPGMRFMILNDAAIVIPQTHLLGLLDRIRTNTLDLALGLEGVSIDAGTPGGPTVNTDESLSQHVHVQLIQLNATDSTLTFGDGNTVASGKASSAIHLEVGDVQGLLAAAGQFVNEEGVTALTDALSHDGGVPGVQTRSVLQRVRAGTYVLAGGLATNAAYDGLISLLGQVFPGSFS